MQLGWVPAFWLHPNAPGEPPICSGSNFFDTNNGAIFTTMDWNSPREGIRFTINDSGRFRASIFRAGSTSNRFPANADGFHGDIDVWLHVTVVWKIDPKFDIYVDGEPKTVSQGSDYGTSPQETFGAQMRMALGRPYVSYTNAVKTIKMIFDELIMFDRPLESHDLLVYLV